MTAIVLSSILLLVVGQMISFGISYILPPSPVTYLVSGALYAALCFYAVLFASRKTGLFSLEDIGLRKKPSPLWIGVSAIMPIAVLLCYMVFSGDLRFNNHSAIENVTILSRTLFAVSLAAGFSEELIFRGVMMYAIEKRFSSAVAIVSTSVIFALLHIVGRGYSTIDSLQVVLSGSIIAILFALVRYESGSLVNTMIMHSVWNFFMTGSLISVGPVADNNAIASMVIDSDNMLFTGGAFGAEASIIAVIVYLLFAFIAFSLIAKK